MSVYVDDYRARHGRLILCHMLADTEEELHEMADRVGVARRWFQGDHYDVCLSKRSEAVRLGAVEVTRREMVRIRRATNAPIIAPTPLASGDPTA